MCGRVYMAPADPELRRLVNEMNRSVLAEKFKNEKGILRESAGEVFPSEILPVIATSRKGNTGVFPMKWGFSGPKGTIINARMETAAQRPTFREAWRSHRCAVPATGYFEWEHDGKKQAGQKYILRPEDEKQLHLAGLYRMEGDLPAFVILTRPADPSLAWLHDRMPLILPRDAVDEWIRPESDPEAAAAKCLKRMVWEKAV